MQSQATAVNAVEEVAFQPLGRGTGIRFPAVRADMTNGTNRLSILNAP
jgi:hypothetical protein